MEAQSTQGRQKSARLTVHPIMLSEAISMETGKEALHCITLHCQCRVASQSGWNCPFLLLSVYFLPISGLLIWIQMELDSVLDASVTTCVNWKFYLISTLKFIHLWNRETSFLVTSALPPNCYKKLYTKCLVQSLVNSKRSDKATRIIIQPLSLSSCFLCCFPLLLTHFAPQNQLPALRGQKWYLLSPLIHWIARWAASQS